MSQLARIGSDVQEGVRELLEHLLTRGDISGVFCLTREGEEGFSHRLIRDPAQLSEATPFHPVMPANGGGVLAALTAKGPVTGPILAVLRPCEEAAYIELVKRGQASLEGIRILSCTCEGVHVLRDVLAGRPEELRETCRACTSFLPSRADLMVLMIGRSDGACTVLPESDAGRSLLDGLELDRGDAPAWREELEETLRTREAEREKLLGSPPFESPGLEGLARLLGSCIGCRGCSNVCPVCSCELCFFRTAQGEIQRVGSRGELDARGGVKVPPMLTLFHLGRMMHMAYSCVGCGMCSDVCPARIPVATLFQKAAGASLDLFGYRPGVDPEEPVPLQTYREQELEEFGQ